MKHSLNEATITDLAVAIANGSITSESLVRACLDRIREREAVVGAWIHLDEEKALAQAQACDRRPVQGPLHGIPVGIKDILDTRDMPTAYGSPIYEGHFPIWDSACVALLRRAGAVILGKTVTTEFAWRKPGKTANPHHPGHTPGGSSSGSAAAVADCMVPLAVGSQTGGSVIRPASYCGVVGYKPTFGQLSLAGVKPLAHSLDTLGCFVKSVQDLLLFRSAIWGISFEKLSQNGPPRIGSCRIPDWKKAGPATQQALGEVRNCWCRMGVEIDEVVLPREFKILGEAQNTICIYEAHQSFQHEIREHEALLSGQLKAHFDPANPVVHEQYSNALETARICRVSIQAIFQEYDLLLAPSAPDEAPYGLDFTGDAIFNRMWTLLHLPAINLPVIRGPQNLPVGVQLIGAYGADASLVRNCICLESFLRNRKKGGNS